jgi:hypothetical protein
MDAPMMRERTITETCCYRVGWTKIAIVIFTANRFVLRAFFGIALSHTQRPYADGVVSGD